MVEFYLDKDSLNKQLNNILDSRRLTKNYVKGVADSFHNTPNLTVNAGDTKLDLTWKLMQNYNENKGNSFIDMKEFFAKSSKVKYKKDGGWYLVVPMGVKARDARANSPRSLWNQISHMDFGQTGSLSSDGTNYLSNLGTSQEGVMSPLKYNWKSANITRVAPASGGGTRGHYIAFRTVSDKSDPNSWIVGRQTFSEDNDDLTDDMKESIKEVLMNKVMNYKLDNLDLLRG